MAQKTNIDLKIVDAVETTHTEAEVIADSALDANKEALYFAMGYLARNGVKFLEGIDKEGTYPNLTAGFANDLTGRIEASSEVFTYRPSAGDKSIRDNSATIRSIKGNSVGWNQLIKNGNFDTVAPWYTGNGASSFAVSNNIATVDISNIYDKNNCDIRQKFTCTSNHTYLVSWDYYSDDFAKCNINGYSEVVGSLFYVEWSCNTGKWNKLWRLFTAANSTSNGVIKVAAVNPNSKNGTFQAKNINIHDLTAMFGAGNEPTTVEEFRALYPDDYYEYNAGELRDLNVRGIETVGFNQFNGTYAPVLPNNTYYLGGDYTTLGFTTEIGGTTEDITLPTSTEVVGNAPTDRLYTPTQAGYIYADGSNININLSHTGIRDGEYEPYKKATQSLPISAITGGEPLRRAGAVYDEITQTEYIKRVGVVDIKNLPWSKVIDGGFMAMLSKAPNGFNATTPHNLQRGVSFSWANIDAFTDNCLYINREENALYGKFTAIDTSEDLKAALSGVMLNYELAEPIITPITEPLDLSYYVEDFGTEKALLADNSAPFSADIIYQFNAVDTIRQNEANIERLTSIVNALKANPEILNLTVGSLSILTQIAPALGMSVDLGTALNRWATIFGTTINATNLRLINGLATNVLLGDGSSKPINDITTKLWELTDETE